MTTATIKITASTVSSDTYSLSITGITGLTNESGHSISAIPETVTVEGISGILGGFFWNSFSHLYGGTYSNVLTDNTVVIPGGGGIEHALLYAGSAGNHDAMVVGGFGNDTITGNGVTANPIKPTNGIAGIDILISRSGEIPGTPTATTIFAGSGNNVIFGGAGNDFIIGSTKIGSTAEVFAGSGNTSITINSESGTFFGGTGNDTFTYSAPVSLHTVVYADGGKGSDTLILNLSSAEYALSWVKTAISHFENLLLTSNPNTNNGPLFTFSSYDPQNIAGITPSGLLELTTRNFEVFKLFVNNQPVAPVISVDATSPNLFIAGKGGVALENLNAVITDIGSSTLNSLKVTITNLTDGSAESLSANTAGTHISSVYANGVLTLSGIDTLADYNQVLRSITYNDTASTINSTPRSISFVANDGVNSSNTATTILNLDNPPAIAIANVPENATEQGVDNYNIISNADITDRDHGDTISLTSLGTPTLISNASGATISNLGTFSIVNGELQFNPGSNYINLALGATAVVKLPYTVSDNHGATTSNFAYITVTGQNEAPVIATLNVAENATAQGVATFNLVSDANITDPDHGDTVSLTSLGTATLVSNTSGATINSLGTFSIVNGELQFDPGSNYINLAQGTTAVVKLPYTVSDNHGATTSNFVYITITGQQQQNEPPVVAIPNVPENAAEQGVDNYNLISDANVTDPDHGDTVSLTALGTPTLISNTSGATINNLGSFSIVNGELQFDPGTNYINLALGATAVVKVPYTVSDNHGATTSDFAYITVTGQNEEPTIAIANVPESAAEQGVDNYNLISDANVTDPDHGDTVSLTALGTPTLISNASGATINNLGSFSIVNGELQFDPGTNYINLALGATAVVKVPYTVSDNHGATTSDSAYITVTGQNEAPTIAIANVPENAAEQGVDNYNLISDANVTDPDHGDTVSLTALGTPTLISNASGATINNLGSFSIVNGELQFDPGTNYINLALGATAVVKVPYTVSDNHGATTSDFAYITVTGQNEAPTIAIANVPESAAEQGIDNYNLISDANVTDPDHGDTVSLTALGTPTLISNTSGATINNLGSFSIVNGELQFDPGTNYINLALGATAVVKVPYTVSDNHGTTTSDFAYITVTGQNEAPTIAIANVPENASEQGVDNYNLISDANVTDPDHGDTVSLTALGTPTLISNASGATINNLGSFSIVNGELQFDPGTNYINLALGATAVVKVPYTVSDNHGANTSDSAYITVTGQNEAPTIGVSNVAETANSDASATFNLISNANVTDPDHGDTVSIDAATLGYMNGSIFEPGVSEDGATLTLVNGQVVYNPTSSLTLQNAISPTTDSFQYYVVDNHSLDSSSFGTVSVTVTPAHPPILMGTSGNDIIVGFSNTTAIYGLGGDDILSSGAATGSVILFGGAGNDTLIYDVNNPIPPVTVAGYTHDIVDFDFSGLITFADPLVSQTDFQGYQLTDNHLLSSAQDFSEGTDLTAITQFQFATGSANPQSYVTIKDSHYFGSSGDFNNEIVLGTANDDTLDTTYNNDALIGGNGNDILKADFGATNTLLVGGQGDDTLESFDATGSTIAGFRNAINTYDITLSNDGNIFSIRDVSGNLYYNEGTDTIDTSSVDGNNNPDLAITKFNFGGANYSINGSIGNLVLGSTGNDTIVALANTTVLGLAGNDTLEAFGTNVYLVGGEGNDTLLGYSDGTTTAGYAKPIASYDFDTTGDPTFGRYLSTITDESNNADNYNEGTDTYNLDRSNPQADITSFNFGGVDYSITPSSYAGGAASSDNQIVFGTSGDDNVFTTGVLSTNNYNNVALLGLGGDDTLLATQNSSMAMLVGGPGNDTLDAQGVNNTATAGYAQVIEYYSFSNISMVTDSLSSTSHLQFNITDLGFNPNYNEGTDTVDNITHFEFAGNTYTSILQLSTQTIPSANANNQIAFADTGLGITGPYTNVALVDTASGAGDLVASSGSTNAILMGGTGDDTLTSQSGSNGAILVGGAGDDTLNSFSNSTIAFYYENESHYLAVPESLFPDLPQNGALIITEIDPNAVVYEGADFLNNSNLFQYEFNNQIVSLTSIANGIYGTSGNDTIHSGAFQYVPIYGLEGNDTLIADSGSDNVLLSGGDGNDTLIASAGSVDANLEGGPGNDTLTDNSSTAIAIYTNPVYDYTFTQTAAQQFLINNFVTQPLNLTTEGIDILNDITRFNFEGVQYNSFVENSVTADNQIVLGNSTQPNTINTLDASNVAHSNVVIFGGSGDDTLTASAGSDSVVLIAGGGDDTLTADPGSTNVTLVDGPGNDTMVGNDSTTAVFYGDASDFALSESGNQLDVVDVSPQNDPYDGSAILTGISRLMFDGILYTGQALQNLFNPVVIGTSGDDTLHSGTTPGVTVYGLAGDDTLIADPGSIDAKLVGGPGNDTLIDQSGSVINPGTAIAVFSNDIGSYDFGLSNNGIISTVAAADVSNTDGTDTLSATFGGGFSNFQFGSQLYNTVTTATLSVSNNTAFSSGVTTVSNEILTGEDINGIVINSTAYFLNDVDTLSAAPGTANDALIGGLGNDILTAENGSTNAVLIGGPGDDTLTAANGSVGAVLVGGAGNDTLIADAQAVDPVARYYDNISDYTATYSPDGSTITITLNDSSAPIQEGTDTVTGITEFEFNGVFYNASAIPLGNIIGTPGDDTLQSGPVNGIQVSGLAGDDTLVANAGSSNIQLIGGPGNDTLIDESGQPQSSGIIAVYSNPIQDYQISTSNSTMFLSINGSLILAPGLQVSGQDSLGSADGTDTIFTAHSFPRFDFGGVTYNTVFSVGLSLVNGQYIGTGVANQSNEMIVDLNNSPTDSVISTDTLEATSGTTRTALLGGAGNDSLQADAGSSYATLIGGPGNDILTAESGSANVVLVGGAGNDTLIAQSGATNVTAYYYDTISNYSITPIQVQGGFDYSLTLNDPSALVNEGTDTLIGISQFSFDGVAASLINIAGGTVTGTAGDDTLSTGPLNGVTLLGLAGDDTLTASAGSINSILVGGDGNDTLIAAAGSQNAILEGDAGSNTLIDDSGSAIANYGLNIGSYALTATTNPFGNLESVSYLGNNDPNGGTDSLSGFTHFDFGGDLYNSFVNPIPSFEPGPNINFIVAEATSANEILSGANTLGLASFSGATLYALANNDALIGSSANDTLVADAGTTGVILIGGQGDDTLTDLSGNATAAYAFSIQYYDFGFSNGTIQTVTSTVPLTGYNEGQDTLSGITHFNFGGVQYNTITNDVVTGNNEIVLGTSGNDTISSVAGSTPVSNVVIMGGDGDDTLTAVAGSSNVTLMGGNGDDTLIVQSGSTNDILVGGAGYDTLIAPQGDTTTVAHYFDDISQYQALITEEPNGDTQVVLLNIDPSPIINEDYDILTNVPWLDFNGTVVAPSAVASYTIPVITGAFTDDILDSGNLPYVQIYGLAGDDTLTADSESYAVSLIGGAGNDTLIDNSLTNSAIATYANPINDFQFGFQAGIVTTLSYVGNNPLASEGTDTLTNISHFSFDGTVFNSAIQGNASTADNQIVVMTGNSATVSNNNVALIGTTANDTMIATGTNEILVGGQGDDSLSSTVGDTIAGYAHPINDFTFNFSGNNISTVSFVGGDQSNDEGTDTLSNISNFLFDTNSYSSVQGSLSNLVYATESNQIVLAAAGIDTALNSFYPYANVALIGSTGNDTLTAFSSDTLLVGGQGNDTLEGNDFNTIAGYAHPINDYQFTVNTNNDTTTITFVGGNKFYNEGTDTLQNISQFNFDGMPYTSISTSFGGASANDQIYVGSGSMSTNGYTDVALIGGPGNDTLTADSSGAVLVGGAGNDIIQNFLSVNDTVAGYAYPIADYQFSGNSFSQTFTITDIGSNPSYNEGTDTLTNITHFNFDGATYSGISFNGEATANNQIVIAEGNSFFGNYSGLAIIGGSGNDILTASGSGDTLVGGQGNDTLQGYSSGDTVAGYAHPINDFQFNFSGFPTSLSSITYVGENQSFNEGTDTFENGSQAITHFNFDGMVYSSIVPISNGDGNATADHQIDVLTSSGILSTNGFVGVALIGSTGSDTLIANSESDILVGGPGNDLLIGSPATNDTIAGYASSIVNYAFSLGSTLIQQIQYIGTNTSYNEGTDTLSNIGNFNFDGAPYTYVSGTTLPTGQATGSYEIVGDTNGSGLSTGNFSNVELVGSSGDDFLMATAPNALLEGGVGNDTLIGDSSSMNTAAVYANPISDFIFNFNSSNTATVSYVGSSASFNEGTDSLTDISNFYFQGIAYTSNVGTSNNVSVTAANQIVGSSQTGVTLNANQSFDNTYLAGTTGSDTLNANNGAHVILDGGAGSDNLNGSTTGVDTYLYGALADRQGGAVDTIQNFTSGVDFLKFEPGYLTAASIALLQTPGNVLQNVSGTPSSTITGNAVFVQDTVNHNLYYDTDGPSNPGGLVEIAHFTNPVILHAADILHP